MATKKLEVEISDTLYDRFYNSVTERGGIFRSKDKKETAHNAFRSAVEVAIKEFLDLRSNKRDVK